MDILLDTHTLLWMLQDDPRLRPRQFQVLENPENRLFVSAISVFEIATKVRIGKLRLAIPVAELIDHVFGKLTYLPLSVSYKHGQRAGTLPGSHRDPFDRLLAAQALDDRMPLMSSDEAFREFGVEVVW